MQYAKALLQKAQAESDPLGGRLKTGETVCAAADDEEEEEEEGEAEGEGDEDGAQEADDLELAFQCFEVARVIYQKVDVPPSSCQSLQNRGRHRRRGHTRLGSPGPWSDAPRTRVHTHKNAGHHRH